MTSEDSQLGGFAFLVSTGEGTFDPSGWRAIISRSDLR